MSTLFTLTVTDQGHNTKVAETQFIHDVCQKAAQMVRSQKKVTSGNVVIERGVAAATWSYTGTASNDG
jgi:hypothetical protein